MDRQRIVIYLKILAVMIVLLSGIFGFVLSAIKNPEHYISLLSVVGTGTNSLYPALVSSKTSIDNETAQQTLEQQSDDQVFNPEHGLVIEQIENLKPSEEMVDNNSSFFADKETAIALIPIQQRKPTEEVSLNVSTESEYYLKFGNGITLNKTSIDNDEAIQQLEQPPPYTIELNSDQPQVLIFHTHATESFDRFDAGFYDVNYPTRSTDSKTNIVKVGETIVKTLNENGINTVHATDYHDYPSYDGSYYRSADTVAEYMEKYPSIKVFLDIHRDGLEREDGTRIKPIVNIDGKKVAQIMLVCNADDGTLWHPDFYENFRLAARLQSSLETHYPGITRPILFDYRDYNQFMAPGMLLVEVGSHGNSLEEAIISAAYFGTALVETLKELS